MYYIIYKMDVVYVMINSSEWENFIIYTTKEEAIEASIKYQNSRIEIFGKKIDCKGYFPTYNYYNNGILYNK